MGQRQEGVGCSVLHCFGFEVETAVGDDESSLMILLLILRAGFVDVLESIFSAGAAVERWYVSLDADYHCLLLVSESTLS